MKNINKTQKIEGKIAQNTQTSLHFTQFKSILSNNLRRSK